MHGKTTGGLLQCGVQYVTSLYITVYQRYMNRFCTHTHIPIHPHVWLTWWLCILWYKHEYSNNNTGQCGGSLPSAEEAAAAVAVFHLRWRSITFWYYIIVVDDVDFLTHSSRIFLFIHKTLCGRSGGGRATNRPRDVLLLIILVVFSCPDITP